MRRGELYRVRKPGGRDPKQSRVFVIVSRDTVVNTAFPTVICAPIHTGADGLSTQVPIGPESGLKHPSYVLCDGLVSVTKSRLTDYVGVLRGESLLALDQALAIAVGID